MKQDDSPMVSARLVALADNTPVCGSLFINRKTKVPLLVRDVMIPYTNAIAGALYERLCTQSFECEGASAAHVGLQYQKEIESLFPGYDLQFFNNQWIKCRVTG